MVSEVLDIPGLLKGTDTRFQTGFHCVILDLKDLPSHLFRGKVTYNNLPELLFGFFMNTDFLGNFNYFTLFLNNLTLSPLFPH